MVGVVENIAVSILLGTTLISRFIKERFPAERKIMPFHSNTVEIFASFDGPMSVLTDTKANETDAGQNTVSFRVAVQTRMEPMVESLRGSRG